MTGNAPPQLRNDADRLSAFNRWLDEQVLNDGLSGSQLLHEICEQLVRLRVASHSRVVLIHDGVVTALPGDLSKDSAHPDSLKWPAPKILDAENYTAPYVSEHIEGRIFAEIQVRFARQTAAALQITGHQPGTWISDSVFTAISDRVILAIRLKEERAFDKVFRDSIDEYLAEGMRPSVAWSAIAKFAARFVPELAPLALDPITPLCQVLTYTDGDKYFCLRANQKRQSVEDGPDAHDQLLLRLDETICGIPIQLKQPFLLVDPTSANYSDRYGAFLFEETVRSELVIVLKSAGRTIGVLNFEHPRADAFDEYTIKSLVRGAGSLAPFVAALVEREERQRSKDVATMYVVGSMLQRMNGMLSHKVGNSVFKARLLVDDIVEQPSVSERTKEQCGYLLNEIAIIHSRSDSFLQDVPNYLKPDCINLRSILDEAVRDAALAIKPEERDVVSIAVDGDTRDVSVYASALLREHIFNLLNNSLYFVLRNLAAGNSTSGNIRVLVERKTVRDRQERDKSSPGRVYITVTDNGTGVLNPFDMPKIREYGFTTKGADGSGYGLPAAMQYVQSILGGEFTYGNNADGGFFVRFFVLEFESELARI